MNAAAITPDSILVLTFSRKAAADLRARIAGRLGRTTVTPMAMTFHAFCYALVRRFGDGVEPESNGFGAPLRLLTGPEQEFRLRETLRGQPGNSARPVAGLVARRISDPGLRRVRSGRCWPRRGNWAWIPMTWSRPARRPADRSGWASGSFFDEYLDVLDAEGVLDYAELVHRCRILLAEPEIVATLRREIAAVFVDEYQDTDPAQVRLLQAIAGDGRDVVVVGDPDQSIYAFRGAEARGHSRLP